MARIEPIPWDALPARSRAMLEEGMASGMYTTPVPMQVVAYSSVALEAMHASYTATFRRGLLEPRLVELLRLHSAQSGACAPCATSRKDESVTEDDVACLVDVEGDRFDARERAALRFFDDLASDHHRIDGDYLRDLHEIFSVAEIVELGYLCGMFLGGHRFLHTLGVLGDEPPVLTYDPIEVDRSRAGDAAREPS
jgi:alkylhydroperoxidase family enzyme